MHDQAVILLAEDNADDILVIRKAFQRSNLLNPVHIVRDGEEAIAYLQGVGKYGSRDEYPLPDLMLLDLKMPKVGGFEVLSWIRSHPTLRALCVVVLTTSNDMRDVNRAYGLGANSFLIKPMDFEQTTATIELLKRYWLERCKIPEVSRPPKNRSPRQD
jgi:CheY-like chemotaxis protein